MSASPTRIPAQPGASDHQPRGEARGSDSSDDGVGLGLPELADAGWMYRATVFAHTSFWAVARRLEPTTSRYRTS
jgi:hypothetical protein